MNRTATQPLTATPAQETVRAGLVLFAGVDIALALFMVIAPRAFHSAVGPYGTNNPHYIRDVASFYGALGIATWLAVARPSWRVPVLALSTLQYGLHTANHLLDIGNAHPHWSGYANFASLLAGTAILAWMWRTAAAETPPPTERSLA